MSFTRQEFWGAVGLLLTIVCLGAGLLWVAVAVSNARRGRMSRHGQPPRSAEVDADRAPPL